MIQSEIFFFFYKYISNIVVYNSQSLFYVYILCFEIELSAI